MVTTRPGAGIMTTGSDEPNAWSRDHLVTDLMSAARCDWPKLYASIHGPCTNGPEMFQRAPTSNSNRRPQKVGRRKFPSLSSHPSTTNNNHRNNSLACNCKSQPFGSRVASRSVRVSSPFHSSAI